MPRPNIDDLSAFIAVASERSFTKAAVKLDVSPSALSHTIRLMEQRLGVRLLERTTRSVATTEAGQRLLSSVGPRMDEIEAEPEAILPFPWQNALTRPLRRAAAKQERAEFLSLWAGQGLRLAQGGPAAELVARVAGQAAEVLRTMRA